MFQQLREHDHTFDAIVHKNYVFVRGIRPIGNTTEKTAPRRSPNRKRMLYIKTATAKT